MSKILNQEELDEMENRIHQTCGMGKFSPKDVMDLIYTAQKYMVKAKEMEKNYEILKEIIKN